MASFRNLVSAILLLIATAIGGYVLRFDSFLQSTPNYHWVLLLVFTVVDVLLAFELILTSQLRLWVKTLRKVAGVWACLMVLAIAADAVISLQLPGNYPPIDSQQSFQYLLLGLNGNPVPLGVPALFSLYALIALLALLPDDLKWFKLNSLPTRRTALAIIIIVILVMGARPVFIAYSYLQNPSLASSTQIINAPVKHNPLPYDPVNRTTFLTLVAEANPMMPYNYNNTHNGQLVVHIPADWNLRLVFINQEGTTHNAVLLKPYATAPINLTEDRAVIAQIPENAMQGGFLVSGGSGVTTVTNLAPGTYWVACALTYPTPHAEEGMWIVIMVSSSVTEPYYTITG